jgi:thioredoxin reductase
MSAIPRKQHEVIVIGAGAAGLSAALVLARAWVDVLVIDAGEPRNATAEHMHVFVSQDGISPAEFLAIGRREVKSYGGIFSSSTVTSIHRSQDGTFDLLLANDEPHTARTLLFATGLKDELPDIPGLQLRWGSQVHHCPYCHGREVSDQKITVIGGLAKEMSLKQCGLLRRYSERVDFITNGIEMTDNERQRLEAFGVRIVEGTVSRLVGEAGDPLDLELVNGQVIRCDAVFIAPLPRPTVNLPLSLGCKIDSLTGFLAADAAGQTSQPGIWAAGNVVSQNAQVISAAGAGSTSAMAINGWLLQKDLDEAYNSRTAHYN